MKIEEAIEELKKGKKRNFNQTYDLIINLKNIDIRKPENKVSKEVFLPHGRGKPASVCVISEQFGFNKSKLEEIGSDKKKAKLFSKKYEFFLASADLMVVIGKALGRYLAPAGKMPQPLPPNMSKEQIEGISKRKENSIRLKIKNMPTFQVTVGTESMKPEEIRENIEAVIKEAVNALPKGQAQIRNVSLKLTMSKPVKIDLSAK